MAYAFPPDVSKLVQEQMARGGYASEDDLLRDALAALSQFQWTDAELTEEFQQTVEAVREGLDDFAAGRSIPLRELIQKHRDSQNAEG